MSRSYYESITTKSAYTTGSQGKETLKDLVEGHWTSAASDWGCEQLFAHQVICTSPTSQLPILSPFLPNNPSATHACIAALIEGPGSIHGLTNESEPRIVRRFQPDSLGYVWAALARLEPSPASTTPSTPRPVRVVNPPAPYGGGVPSDQADLGSSPPQPGRRRTETPESDASFRSAGYYGDQHALALEESSISLASCFIRCVLNYGQPLNKQRPFAEFRDERQLYSYLGVRGINAIDDGGIEISDRQRQSVHQVALLEGKRAFQQVVEGHTVVSDGLLGQLVAESLALAMHQETSREDFFTILIVRQRVAFFHFRISQSYRLSYEDIRLEDYLMVDSTVFFDVRYPDHRKIVVSHLLALISWADQQLS